MNKRCVIISGATINNYDKIKSYLRKDDYYVCCDSGLMHKDKLDIEPNLIVADFDSYKKENFNAETISLPCEKDDTDTFYAIKECAKRGFKDFLLIGVIGNRLDHTMSNIYDMLWIAMKNINVIALDDYSQIEIIIPNKSYYVDESAKFFSIIALTDIEGLNIKNAKYNVKDALLKLDNQYAVSNEVIKGKKSKIYIKSGQAILIKDLWV